MVIGEKSCFAIVVFLLGQTLDLNPSRALGTTPLATIWLYDVQMVTKFSLKRLAANGVVG